MSESILVRLEDWKEFGLDGEVIIETTEKQIQNTADMIVKAINDGKGLGLYYSIISAIKQKVKDWESIKDENFNADVVLYVVMKSVLTNKKVNTFKGTAKELIKQLKEKNN